MIGRTADELKKDEKFKERIAIMKEMKRLRKRIK
jgi:hypothetical protein